MRAYILTAVVLLCILTGCSKHHVARFANHGLDSISTRVEIERCLADLGMKDVSEAWPYSEYIAEFPDDVVAVWMVPPPEFDSWWKRLTYTPKNHGTAWVRPDSEILRVSFHRHDHVLPERFKRCAGASSLGPDVQIESGWNLDLS